MKRCTDAEVQFDVSLTPETYFCMSSNVYLDTNCKAGVSLHVVFLMGFMWGLKDYEWLAKDRK
jgi:hypothetical protein